MVRASPGNLAAIADWKSNAPSASSTIAAAAAIEDVSMASVRRAPANTFDSGWSRITFHAGAAEVAKAAAGAALDKIDAAVQSKVDQVMGPINKIQGQMEQIGKGMEAVANGDLGAAVVAGIRGRQRRVDLHRLERALLGVEFVHGDRRVELVDHVHVRPRRMKVGVPGRRARAARSRRQISRGNSSTAGSP